jgi:hypothetical protein
MKPTFNKTCLIIAVITIVNIFIFYFASKKLENFVLTNTSKTMIKDGLL